MELELEPRTNTKASCVTRVAVVAIPKALQPDFLLEHMP